MGSWSPDCGEWGCVRWGDPDFSHSQGRGHPGDGVEAAKRPGGTTGMDETSILGEMWKE